MSNLYFSAILQKYLDNFDLSIKIVYIMGTLGFSIGTSHSIVANAKSLKTKMVTIFLVSPS